MATKIFGRDLDVLREQLMEQARSDCPCAKWAEPCTTHLAYEQGIRDGHRALRHFVSMANQNGAS